MLDQSKGPQLTVDRLARLSCWDVSNRNSTDSTNHSDLHKASHLRKLVEPSVELSFCQYLQATVVIVEKNSICATAQWPSFDGTPIGDALFLLVQS